MFIGQKSYGKHTQFQEKMTTAYMIGREKEGSHVFYMLVQLSLKVQQ